MSSPNRSTHIRLTSHPEPSAATSRHPIKWGAADPRERGPIIGSVTNPADRNVIGTHGGSYALYRALAVSSGALNPIRRPDLTNTQPAASIGPFPQWSNARTIVSLDPWGHMVSDAFQAEIAEGFSSISPSSFCSSSVRSRTWNASRRVRRASSTRLASSARSSGVISFVVGT